MRNQTLSDRTESDLNAQLELCKLRMTGKKRKINKNKISDNHKFNRARKRLANQLLDKRRVKKRKLGAGRPVAMDEEDEHFLAKFIAEKSTTHGRRHNTVMYLNHRVKKRNFLSLVNYNILRKGKKLIRSATKV